MTWGGNKNGIVWHHRSHQISSLIDGIEINAIQSIRLHSTRQTIHLTTITVNCNKWSDTITDMLL